MKNVSVIIRCRNEESHIGLVIQSAIDLLDNPEILVIDNNSTDDSIKIVSLFDKCDIKIHNIKQNDYTPGKALNYGVQYAKYNTILVLSAHSQITKLNCDIKECLSEYQAVFGNQTPIYRGKKITKRYIWSHFVNEENVENMYSQIEKRHFLHNAFCFYNRDFLLKHPFDENLSGKEDRYWAESLVNNFGGKYLYSSRIKVNHYWTPNGATWKGIG